MELGVVWKVELRVAIYVAATVADARLPTYKWGPYNTYKLL